MAFSYFESTDKIIEQYKTALGFMADRYKEWDEAERIADNRPPDGLAADQEKITDSTIASYIMRKPRELAREIPVGRVSLPDKPEEEDKLSEILYVNILPHANTEGDPLLKYQQMFENCFTYGFSASWAFTKFDGDYYGADFVVLNPRDIILEPGKKNVFACNYVFVRQGYSKKDLEAIISKETQVARLHNEDEAATEKYQEKWNTALLQEIVDGEGAAGPDDDAKSSTERKENNHPDEIELVWCFQRGLDADQIVINPNATDTNKAIVRSVKNPDPRGEMPIDFMVIDSSIRKPTGRSIIDFVGDTHRLLERQLARYEFNQDLRAQPPVGISGDITDMDIESFVMEPRAWWMLGSNPNNRVEPIKVSNNDNFLANDYGVLKGQMLNIADNGDTSISASAGDPGRSKTPIGIRSQNATIENNDSHAKRRGEDWFSRLAETLINLQIADNDDEEPVMVREAYIAKRKLTNAEYNNSEEKVDYASLAGVIASFQLDTTSSTKQEEDSAKLEQMREIWKDMLAHTQQLQGMVNMRAMTEWLFKRMGIENYEEILPAEAANQPLNPEAAPLEQSPADPELAQEMARNGLDVNQAEQISQLINQGANPQQIEQGVING